MEIKHQGEERTSCTLFLFWSTRDFRYFVLSVRIMQAFSSFFHKLGCNACIARGSTPWTISNIPRIRCVQTDVQRCSTVLHKETLERCLVYHGKWICVDSDPHARHSSSSTNQQIPKVVCLYMYVLHICVRAQQAIYMHMYIFYVALAVVSACLGYVGRHS